MADEAEIERAALAIRDADPIPLYLFSDDDLRGAAEAAIAVLEAIPRPAQPVDVAELVDRARRHVKARLVGDKPAFENGAWQLLLDMADAIEALARENASLRAALGQAREGL